MRGRSSGVNRAVRLPRRELARQLASRGVAGEGADFIVLRLEHIDLQDVSFQCVGGLARGALYLSWSGLSGPLAGATIEPSKIAFLRANLRARCIDRVYSNARSLRAPEASAEWAGDGRVGAIGR